MHETAEEGNVEVVLPVDEGEDVYSGTSQDVFEEDEGDEGHLPLHRDGFQPVSVTTSVEFEQEVLGAGRAVHSKSGEEDRGGGPTAGEVNQGSHLVTSSDPELDEVVFGGGGVEGGGSGSVSSVRPTGAAGRSDIAHLGDSDTERQGGEDVVEAEEEVPAILPRTTSLSSSAAGKRYIDVEMFDSEEGYDDEEFSDE